MKSMIRMIRNQQQRHNRLRLLAAAERIFVARNVAGASLDDVALEAGLTKGAVYSNFRNKGESILEVIRYRQSKLGISMRSSTASPTTSASRPGATCGSPRPRAATAPTMPGWCSTSSPMPCGTSN
ncbi:MAG: TetR/AcrR family transcriptional regulator [Peptidiphaga sp.]